MQDFARKSIHALSHGQKKRICVAGILAMEPQVIILDEPTAGLDPYGVHSLMHLLVITSYSIHYTKLYELPGGDAARRIPARPRRDGGKGA